jgi:hypothetical protein
VVWALTPTANITITTVAETMNFLIETPPAAT